MSVALVGAVCLGCGCTETTPCVGEGGACGWVSVDTETGQGLCTACDALPFEELIERVAMQQAARYVATAGRNRR